MQGKRTKKRIWTPGRLLGLALLLAVVLLLPTLSAFLEKSPAEPPVEELPVEQPPAEEQTPLAPEPAPEPEPEPEPYPNPEKPMLALTFDDGPGSYTDRLLDAFAQHGGKGTFFMVGRYISSFPDTVCRMAEEGHQLANHSWSHAELTKLKPAAITAEIMDTRNKIFEVAGVETKLVRLPYGSTNKTVRAVAEETESTLVRWTVDPQDWRYRDADTVYNAVMERVKDGSIVLVHDIHPTTVDAMERLIPDLQAAGYQLVTVSELIEYRPEEVASVVVLPPEKVEEPEPAPAPEVPEAAPQTPAPAPQAPAAPAPANPTPAPQVPQTPANPVPETQAPAQPEPLPLAPPDTATAPQLPADPTPTPETADPAAVPQATP